MSRTEEGNELLREASGKVGTRVRDNLVVAAVGDEELEERGSHAPCRVVLCRKEKDKKGEVTDHRVDAHTAQLVRGRNKKCVDADHTAVVGWLEVVDDGAKNIRRGHPAAVLLADRALLHVVSDQVVVDSMAREQLFEVVSCHPGAAMSAVEDVGRGEALLSGRHNSSVLSE